MLLITGATGKLGGQIIDTLLKKNVSPTQIAALVRDENKAASLKEKGVALRIGDYDSQPSLDAAMTGIEKVLLVSGLNPEKVVQQHQNVVDAAGKAGVKCLAYTSNCLRDRNTLVNNVMLSHFETENYIMASGLPYPLFRNSQDIIIAQLELLLTYADRFYQRQFITRQATNHQIISRMEDLLNEYVRSDKLPSGGMPPVTYFADALYLSPSYLSRLLKTLTGQSTKQFIIDKVIDLAKEKLSTTSLTMNEIAYDLGFDHPQSFSKLFKSQTRLSPLQFRQSFS